MYNRKLRSRLLNKSRAERAKQALDITAAIGRTLQDVLEPTLKPDATSQSTPEDVVEGSYREVEAKAGEADEIPVEVTIITRPAADTAGSSPTTTGLNIPPAESPSQEIPIETEADDESIPFPDLSLPPGLTSRLQQLREKLSTPPPTATPHLTGETEQENDRFLSGFYSNAVGSRSYKLYVPSGYRGQALPLVVMLHGCTQSADDFATSTRMNDLAERHSFLVLYPAQTFKANIGKCWNWFKESDQQRDQGEPALIAGLTRDVINTYKLDARRVYVAGISAGGAMSMVMAMTYPDLFAAAGVQSGVPYGVAHNMMTGRAVIKGADAPVNLPTAARGGGVKPRPVSTIVFHGDQDSLVHPNNSEQIISQWLEVRTQKSKNGSTPQINVTSGQVPGGHAYTRSIYKDGNGPALMEQWLVHGAGHAWSGGNPNIAWTDDKGPDASQEMLRFFFEHPHPEA